MFKIKFFFLLSVFCFFVSRYNFTMESNKKIIPTENLTPGYEFSNDRYCCCGKKNIYHLNCKDNCAGIVLRNAPVMLNWDDIVIKEPPYDEKNTEDYKKKMAIWKNRNNTLPYKRYNNFFENYINAHDIYAKTLKSEADEDIKKIVKENYDKIIFAFGEKSQAENKEAIKIGYQASLNLSFLFYLDKKIDYKNIKKQFEMYCSEEETKQINKFLDKISINDCEKNNLEDAFQITDVWGSIL